MNAYYRYVKEIGSKKEMTKPNKNFSSEKATIIMKFLVTQFQMRKSKMK